MSNELYKEPVKKERKGFLAVVKGVWNWLWEDVSSGGGLRPAPRWIWYMVLVLTAWFIVNVIVGNISLV